MHPNPDGPTVAESPYTRKLKRVRDDMSMVLSISPSHQREDVYALILRLDMLIAGI